MRGSMELILKSVGVLPLEKGPFRLIPTARFRVWHTCCAHRLTLKVRDSQRTTP